MPKKNAPKGLHNKSKLRAAKKHVAKVARRRNIEAQYAKSEARPKGLSPGDLEPAGRDFYEVPVDSEASNDS